MAYMLHIRKFLESHCCRAFFYNMGDSSPQRGFDWMNMSYHMVLWEHACELTEGVDRLTELGSIVELEDQLGKLQRSRLQMFLCKAVQADRMY